MNMDEISPGVRQLVAFLNAHNFHTTDSGDGSNFKAGMSCALEYPNVFMVVTPASDLQTESLRLFHLLVTEGVDFMPSDDPEVDDYPTIEGSYSPRTGIAILALLHVQDSDLARFTPSVCPSGACSECDGKHHWSDACRDPDGAWRCKHCNAKARSAECSTCGEDVPAVVVDKDGDCSACAHDILHADRGEDA